MSFARRSHTNRHNRSDDASDETDGQPEIRAGTVTKLSTQVRNPNRMSVFLDDTFAFGVGANRIIEAGLANGEYLSEQRVAELTALDAADRATDAAILLLSYRPRAIREITDRLRSKGFDDAAQAAALERLERWGYVDDADFARRWVENRTTHRPRGRRLLAQELRQKGIDRETVTETLADAELDEDAAALTVATARARSYTGLAHTVAQRRLSGLLARRGFDGQTIRRVVDQVLGVSDET